MDRGLKRVYEPVFLAGPLGDDLGVVRLLIGYMYYLTAEVVQHKIVLVTQ